MSMILARLGSTAARAPWQWWAPSLGGGRRVHGIPLWQPRSRPRIESACTLYPEITDRLEEFEPVTVGAGA